MEPDHRQSLIGFFWTRDKSIVLMSAAYMMQAMQSIKSIPNHSQCIHFATEQQRNSISKDIRRGGSTVQYTKWVVLPLLIRNSSREFRATIPWTAVPTRDQSPLQFPHGDNQSLYKLQIPSRC